MYIPCPTRNWRRSGFGDTAGLEYICMFQAIRVREEKRVIFAAPQSYIFRGYSYAFLCVPPPDQSFPPIAARTPPNMGYDKPYVASVTAASVMQFVAIALVSVVLFLVVAAALRTAPTTGKLGLAAGTTLAVFSVFQLIVFSLAASVTKTCEKDFPG